ncbi:MAG: potassium transporter TrkG, partial [Candidatus Hydrogenedentota bacterium]
MSRYFIGVVALAAFVLLLAENTPFGDAHQRVFRIVNLGVWLVFVAEVLVRLYMSADKAAYLRRCWLDFIVFIPLIQYIPGAYEPSVSTIVRQVVIVVMLVSRIRRARNLLELLGLKPAQVMLSGFIGAIGVGSVLLMLPVATTSGERLPLIDAIFTATSAVCVTGLIVQDTATYFSTFGQMVILALIQVGGLGIMTFSVALAVLLGKPMDVGQRSVLRDALDNETLAGVRSLIRFIVLMTGGFELVGGVLLFFSWRHHFDSVWVAAYHSFFHAVSAFCNAGFSTFSDSLMSFQANSGVNTVVCTLIVFGGLGFVVIQSLFVAIRNRFQHKPRNKLRVQTAVVLRVTLLLIVAGTVFLYLVERSGLLAGMSSDRAVMGAVFQSITARTAGFNTLDIGRLSSAALFTIIVLMFIGASPGSTGGGIKTTTVACLWATVTARLRNRPHVEMHHRTIPTDMVYKAVGMVRWCISTWGRLRRRGVTEGQRQYKAVGLIPPPV